MPHQNVDSSKATAQNAATSDATPNANQNGGDERTSQAPREPASYVAGDYREATAAAPAAGEISDFTDDGDALDGEEFHTGGTNTNRPRTTDADSGQGPKTRAANQRIVRTGSAD